LLLAKVSILGPEHFHELIAHHREDLQEEPLQGDHHDVKHPWTLLPSIFVVGNLLGGLEAD
jgi:hypothetical protein